jgi:hypothetical protein
MNKTTFNFFEQIYYAIFKPGKYYRLTRISGGRLAGFVFLLVLITSLFSIIPIIYSLAGPNGITKLLREDLPEFELKNGELNINERFESNDGTTYILIDTDTHEFTPDYIDNSYRQVILVSRTNLISYRPYGRIQQIFFSDLAGITLNNRILNALIPFFYLFLLFMGIFIYLFMAGAYFFTALLYSLLGLFVSSIRHVGLTYAAVYKTAVYSKVTISLLYALLDVTPLAIPGFIKSIITILVTIVYVVFGILSHASAEAKEEAGFINLPRIYQ